MRKHQIISREKENENLKKYYDKKIDVAKYDNEKKLQSVHERGDQVLIEKSIQLQEKLDGYKKNLTTHKLKLDKEKEHLTISHSDRMESIDKNLKLQIAEQYEKSKEYNLEIDQQIKNHIENLDYKTNRQIEGSKLNANNKLQETTRFNKKRIANTDQKHKTKMQTDKINYIKKMTDAEMDHIKRFQKIKFKNLSEVKEQEKMHNDILLKKQNQQKETLTQTEISFKEKYEIMKNDHNAVLKRAQERFTKDITDLSAKHSSFKKSMIGKIDDDFYNVDKLNTHLMDLGDKYIVTVDVTEHEKECVQLSAYKRKIKISLARRFSDAVQDNNGIINKSRRSELCIKELDSKDILDPSKITQRYENGKLEFQIMKL